MINVMSSGADADVDADDIDDLKGGQIFNSIHSRRALFRGRPPRT